MTPNILRETEEFLHDQIPLTRAMGVQMESYDGQTLVLTAPLEPNHNHLGTAFGGSLSAIATLTGYSLLWLLLGDRESHIVIRESTIRYRHPVRSTIRAQCQSPDEDTVATFKTQFAEVGKARMNLQVTIKDEQRICVEFEGEFVALK